MIRLTLPDAPYWIDLIPGQVRFMVRPLTKVIQAAARNYQRRRLAELSKEFDAVTAAGGQVVDLPNMDDEDTEAGVSELLYAQGLARQAIVEWEGVEDEDGNAVPVTPENCDELMRLPYLADAFTMKYQEQLLKMLSEGND